ncbi:MAG: DUF1538 domain-containing protein [Syntrophomonadaceae bacterium]|nr:DUF1538 domain-containing protein [Syntrophomonadaceae bacterium]
MILSFFNGFEIILEEVAIALSPIFIIVCLFQKFVFHLEREEFANIVKGYFLTFIGIALFLQGVYGAFIPIGQKIGAALGALSHNWILIPVGLLMGFVVILAEPTVRVLNEQVEKASGGYIPQKIMLYSISMGVALSVALAMVRILYGIPLVYILIPGYLLAFFLMQYTNETFIAVAFDSGGVATGPMTVSLIMAMAIGAAIGIEGRDPVQEGFGLIALVTVVPILTVLTLGFLYDRLYKDLEDDDEVLPSESGND